MSKTIRIRKGLNIRLKGEAEKVLVQADPPRSVAIKPTDFHGLTPKLLVKPGDPVKAGTPLFFDKYKERVLFTSPVSGEVADVVRGDKRRILEVRLLADTTTQFEDFGAADPSTLNRETIIQKLLKSGCWPLVRQRPFDIVADPDQEPKAIFVSAFDSAPLAPDLDFVIRNQREDFQAGLDALAKLTRGRVHLNVSPHSTAREFLDARNVQHNTLDGPHPAGNVGVQIHHIDPINKGELVWFCYPQDVVIIGRLFRTGRFDAVRTVAVTGSEARNPKYHRTLIGAPLAGLIGEVDGHTRIVNGGPLTGEKDGREGYLGFYTTQITLLPEGDHPKFFLTEGWMGPGFNKFSASHSYPTWLMPGKQYALDTNQNGEERAFVMTGQYEKVFPFDIYPVHLLKAILVNDIDQMEKLGLYEVAPEDFALCEFVCTSKINSQSMVRDGLDTLKKETT
ncbi:MAG: Na(+)-translocating NADH-quinone reductase subunit A [Flavobacteriales bacterium]|nr:Na(+)-translocating NADH-quinone reductase subunit A [Flavobacteriales bacterium]MCB9168498.1 Na(+)-translocating NADH-quinone reductase subunit A [Flavobacteriales bacterium]